MVFVSWCKCSVFFFACSRAPLTKVWWEFIPAGGAVLVVVETGRAPLTVKVRPFVFEHASVF